MKGVTAVTGPSGSGKTTLLRCLAGLERVDRAEVLFGDQIWDGAVTVPPEQRQIGFVFQNPSLFPHLDVEANIRFGAKRRGRAQIDDVIVALGLSGLLKRSVRSLSGGEARRVSLARAMASDPQILFLDEPMVGLDEQKKSELLPYMARALHDIALPAIYVSHSPDEITTLADRVLGISNGRTTGWQSAPIRLMATVTKVEEDKMHLLVDGATPEDARAMIDCPAIAGIGEKVSLGISQAGFLLTDQRPGQSKRHCNASLPLCRFGERWLFGLWSGDRPARECEPK